MGMLPVLFDISYWLLMPSFRWHFNLIDFSLKLVRNNVYSVLGLRFLKRAKTTYIISLFVPV
jgi:hypothetical protein